MMPTYTPFKDLPNKVLRYYAGQVEVPMCCGHIGASMVGHPCDRRIWLDWQGKTPPSTSPIPLLSGCNAAVLKKGRRAERLEHGNYEEARLVKALQGAGYVITHRQATFSVLDGNLQGQINGIILDPEGHKYILEVQSVSEKAFKALLRKGVQQAFGSSYLKCQLSMHFLKVHRTLFIVVNKNTGEIHRSILTLDEDEVEKGLQKIHRIVMYGKNMPAALGNNPHDAAPSRLAPCQSCDFVSFCYQKKAMV